MISLKDCPEEFVKFANRLADTAGEIHRRHFGKTLEVEIKPDGSPVTPVDWETERVLRKLIEQTYPDHGITGEEYPPVQEDAEFVWVLDPLDGTKSFLAGIPTFGVLIALVHEGRFVLGAVDQPILRDCWIGADGHGTTRNGAPARTRSCVSLAEAVLCVAGPDTRTEPYDDQIAQVRRAARWVRYGAGCYGYGLLASGFVDLLVDASLHNHDFGPLEPIVRNAGGVATDWDGRALSMDSSGDIIAAGDARLIEQVRAHLER